MKQVRDATIDFVIIIVLTYILYQVLPVVVSPLSGDILGVVALAGAYVIYRIVGKDILKYMGV